MKITVFTPTYNRAYTLQRLYESLLKQDYKNFEWLVIDDGSTDDTKKLLNSYIDESIIDIRYYKVSNGGKHRAINMATDLAKGEVFFIVDSDDYLTSNALTRLIYWFGTIAGATEKFAGVSGLKGYSASEIIGNTFAGNYKDALYFERNKYKINGDKAEAFYTDVLRRYKFPEFEGENFITEAVVWCKLAENDYKIRYFNEIIYITEYMKDGLTNKSAMIRLVNINGTLFTYKYLMSLHKMPITLRLRYMLNYIKFYIIKNIEN